MTFCKILTTLTLGALLSSGAAAEPFTLLIYEEANVAQVRHDPKAMQSYWGEFNQLAGLLQQAGFLRGGSALTLGNSTKTVHFGPEKEARVQTSKNSSDVLGGYFLVEAPQAEDLAALLSKAQIKQKIRIEIRSHEANPTMKSDKAPVK